jgi:glycosyltransferase involved in cell wall biosynthesis
MNRILIIEDRIPYPFLGAGFPRSYAILSTLNALGHSVTFYPLKEDEYKGNFQKFRKELSGIEFIIGEQYKEVGIARYINEHKEDFDTILITRPKNMAKLEPILRTGLKGTDVKIIYDAEAIIVNRELMQREFNGEIISEHEKSALLQEEIRPARLADVIWTVSENERSDFIYYGFNPDKIKVVGYTSKINFRKLCFNERQGLLFVGAIHNDRTPNAHSIRWFSHYVLPNLVEEIPKIKLNVVGINSSKTITTLENDNLIFHGKVDITDNFYDTAKVFIAPTHFAAGIPLKIIEAASMGLPVVTTSLIANQLGMKDSKEILVANTPEEFTSKVLGLYFDEKLWYSIRNNALQFIKRRYSQNKFTNDISEAMNAIHEKN